MSHPHKQPPRPSLGSPDFYIAVGTAVSCWDTTPASNATPNSTFMTAAALERAIATGSSHLLRAVSAPAGNGQPVLDLPAIFASMARDAGIPESTASALLARLFVDILALPSIQCAFAGLPLPAQRSAAADWAALAHAAWAAGWYPDLIGRPTFAAGDLSAGWPILFEAASRAFDELITSASSPHGSAQRRHHMAPPTASLPLPRRVGNAVPPPTRQISSAAAFRDSLQELISATPISLAAGQLIMEFVTTVAYNDAATGQVPVAAWVAMSSNTGEYLMTVHDARPQPPVPPQQRPIAAAPQMPSVLPPAASAPSSAAPSVAAPVPTQSHPQAIAPAASAAPSVSPPHPQAPQSGRPAEPPHHRGPVSAASSPTASSAPSPGQPIARPNQAAAQPPVRPIAGVAAPTPVRNAPPPTQYR